MVIFLLAGSPFLALLFAALTGWIWYARSHLRESGHERA